MPNVPYTTSGLPYLHTRQNFLMWLYNPLISIKINHTFMLVGSCKVFEVSHCLQILPWLCFFQKKSKRIQRALLKKNKARVSCLVGFRRKDKRKSLPFSKVFTRVGLVHHSSVHTSWATTWTSPLPNKISLWPEFPFMSNFATTLGPYNKALVWKVVKVNAKLQSPRHPC